MEIATRTINKGENLINQSSVEPLMSWVDKIFIILYEKLKTHFGLDENYHLFPAFGYSRPSRMTWMKVTYFSEAIF